MKEKITGQKSGRKKYSSEFKDRALALSDKVGVPQALAKDLGLPLNNALFMVYTAKSKGSAFKS